MNIKTYLNKTNTIVYNSKVNTGQNPVCELYYGDGFTRVLLNFNTDNIKKLKEVDKIFGDGTNLKHILKFKNCWGLQSIDNREVFDSGKNTSKERTSSFKLYLIRMPEKWDSGVGNDFTVDGFITKKPSLSLNASNWFNSHTEIPWVNGNGAIPTGDTGNIVPIRYFDEVTGGTFYQNYQSFNIGNEDIEMDITDEINDIISGKTNNGFMLKFDDQFEQKKTNTTQYVGFFTQNSSTFFRPYLETTYDNPISDDRNDFYLDKDNRLYFYSRIGGNLTNLDDIPTCSIDSVEYPVKQQGKGIYYIELNLSSLIYSENVMIIDKWSNIAYNNVLFPDGVELDFITKTQLDYFNFGNAKSDIKKYVPNVFGIKNGQKVDRGQIIKLGIQAREEYTVNKSINTTNMELRLYVKETDKQLDVISWDKIDKSSVENYYMLDTDSLLPNSYFIDIRINTNNEVKIFKELLKFDIVNQL